MNVKNGNAKKKGMKMISILRNAKTKKWTVQIENQKQTVAVENNNNYRTIFLNEDHWEHT